MLEPPASSTYYPSLAQVQAAAGAGNVIPIYREFIADLETPVSAYLKVAQGPYSFLLESVEGGALVSRYSIIGTSPYRVVRTGTGADPNPADPLRVVEAELSGFHPVPVAGLPRFQGGAVGYLSYECARHYEPALAGLPAAEGGIPESVFLFNDTLLVFDHLQHRIKILSLLRLDRGDVAAEYAAAAGRIDQIAGRLGQPLARAGVPFAVPAGPVAARARDAAFHSTETAASYTAKVVQAQEKIRRGDTYQLQLSQEFRRQTTAAPFEIYRALRSLNPSPYMYYLALDDLHIVGASPEMLIRVEDGRIETHPIAGTRRRGRDADEDQRMAAELRGSEKERAEHVMLVDLARNDLGRVSQLGSVRVTELMQIERYSHVMHLVSHVVGRLLPEVSAYDALRAYFPHGTVTGAPKIRTMELIAALEGAGRGVYGGCVGYFDLSGNCDTALSIRTIVVQGGVARARAAGGIVFDSTPDEEYRESRNKAQATLRAIELAEERQGMPLPSSGAIVEEA